MSDDNLRQRIEAIALAYGDKVDTKLPDGSSTEDFDRDLFEPLLAVLDEARRAERDSLCGLRISRKSDGVWLHFEPPGSGNKAALNITMAAESKGPITGAAIKEWIAAIERLEPIQAHSKTEFKRLTAQGADVLPPNADFTHDADGRN